MRVTDPAASTAATRRGELRRAFGDALERARRDEAVDGARPPADRSRGRAGERVAGAGAGPGGDSAGDPASPEGLPRVAEGTTPGWPGVGVAPSIALPELREAARAIPPTVWSGRLAGTPAVELGFPGGLAIELRGGAGGVEVDVRCPAPLERAVQADLPALVRTLRDRGVVVLRADVRGAGGGAARGDRGANGSRRR